MTRVYTIGISGPSCSGKTTATRILRRILDKTIILYQDDFYKSDNDIPVDTETGLQNWDCPESVDFERFGELIRYVKSHEGQLPEGYKSNEESNVHDGSDLVTNEVFEQIKNILLPVTCSKEEIVIIFVDGFMLYYNEDVSNQLDCKISFNCSYSSLKSRREKRQGYYTSSENYWVDPPNYFDKIVWPEYVKLKEFYTENRKEENILLLNTDEDSIDQVALKTANKLLELLK